MPFLVRLRPTAAHLTLVGLGVAAIGLGITMDGVLRFLLLASAVVFVVGLGTPLLVSTVCRVPILAVDETGIRLPLMGVHLGWAEIVAVRQSSGPDRPMLLIVPADPQAVLKQEWPWLRSDGRTNIARYGTPITVAQPSVDHTLHDIQSAIARLRPATPTGRGLPTVGLAVCDRVQL